MLGFFEGSTSVSCLSFSKFWSYHRTGKIAHLQPSVEVNWEPAKWPGFLLSFYFWFCWRLGDGSEATPCGGFGSCKIGGSSLLNLLVVPIPIVQASGQSSQSPPLHSISIFCCALFSANPRRGFKVRWLACLLVASQADSRDDKVECWEHALPLPPSFLFIFTRIRDTERQAKSDQASLRMFVHLVQ